MFSLPGCSRRATRQASQVQARKARAAGSRGKGTGRDVVTAQEVLRLAIVLDVPPVWLLADPEDTQTEIPVSNDVAVDPWTAILWISGRQPLGEPSPRWSAAAQPMTWAWQAATISAEIAERLRFRRIGFQHTIVDNDGQHDQQDAEAAAQTDRRSLDRLVPLLDAINKGGYTAPPLPESVITRARELGVDLPGRTD